MTYEQEKALAELTPLAARRRLARRDRVVVEGIAKRHAEHHSPVLNVLDARLLLRIHARAFRGKR